MAKSAIYVDSYGRWTTKKDPNSTLDYSYAWTDWLEAVGDTAASYEFRCSGLTLVSTGEGDGIPYAIVSGGVVGAPATLTCTITTVAGRVEEQSLRFIIAHK